MANVLEWIFRLRDQVSPSAKSASGSVGDFVQTLHSGLAVVQYASQGLRTLGSAIAAGVAPAVSREKTLGAFTTMLGSAASATDLYREAVEFANATPFETQDIVGSYKQLLAAQFQKEDLQTVVRIVGDASSLQEFPAQAMESVNRALGQIKSKGKLSQEELNQVAEAVPLNQSMFLTNLAKLYGVSLDQARALKEAGKVDADSGVYAILQTLQQQFGGNMESASKQVGGLWSTIKSMPSTYLERLQDTSGYDSLRQSLLEVTDALNPASEQGEQFGAFLDRIGSGVLDRVADSLTAAGKGAMSFAEGFDAGFGALERATTDEEKARRMSENMRDIGNAAGMTAKAVLAVGSAVGWAYGKLVQVGDWWEDHSGVLRFMELIPGVGGVLRGARAAAEYAAESVTTGTSEGTTQQRLTAQRNLERYGSPVGHSLTDWERSRYEMLAGQGDTSSARGYAAGLDTAEPLTAEGLADRVASRLAYNEYGAPGNYVEIPAMAGGGVVRRPTLALIGESGPEEVRPLGSGGAPQVSLSFVYQAGSGGSRGDAEDVERRVEAGVRAALERWQLQSGRRAA